MSNFTPEQLQELEARYGLVPSLTFPVRDGVVQEGDTVWWRAEDGPEQVRVDNTHFKNIKLFPDAYQIKEPRVKIIYED